MEIIIEPKARDYILKKVSDKTITIEAAEKPGGDEHKLAITEYPSVAKGRSKDYEKKPHNYDEALVEGIKVFYRRKFDDRFKGITVKAEKVFFMTMLVAECVKK